MRACLCVCDIYIIYLSLVMLIGLYLETTLGGAEVLLRFGKHEVELCRPLVTQETVGTAGRAGEIKFSVHGMNLP